MHLPRSAAQGSLIVLDQAGSTNDELLRIAADAAEFTTVVTLDQRSGRGRLGRSWVAKPGRTLAASVLLRPRLGDGKPLPPDSLGWCPLLAGTAMTAAVNAVLPSPVARLKWPNDVLVGGRKVSGLLSEVGAGGALVVGSGVNLLLSEEELPVPTAISLALAGAPLAAGIPPGQRPDELVDLLLSCYLSRLRELTGRLLAAGGDPLESGAHAEVSAVCDTLGREVRVDLPGGGALEGTAVGIDPIGRLQVREGGGDLAAVGAGDVVHVRPARRGAGTR